MDRRHEAGKKRPFIKESKPNGPKANKRPPAQDGKPNGQKPNKRPFARENKPDEFDGLKLEGRNAVLEALKAERSIDKIFIKSGESDGSLRVIAAQAREKGIVLIEVEKGKLDAMSETGKHQGVVALCPAHDYASVADMLQKAAYRNEPPFILVLDGITDPHNLGAILRSADACGVHGVIIPKRRAVGLTAIVSKTSAGAINHVLVARVANIPGVLDELRKAGLWIACADMGGGAMFKTDLTGPIAVVIGDEGEGVGRLAAEKSDYHISIPMRGKMSSMNASVAAGVVMVEIVRQRYYQS